jgi:hypothetical protein
MAKKSLSKKGNQKSNQNKNQQPQQPHPRGNQERLAQKESNNNTIRKHQRMQQQEKINRYQ